MFVAERYLALAEPAKHEPDLKLGDTAAEFAPGATPSAETCRLTFIAADLSSAAMRLATVDEVLRRVGAIRSGYRECIGYYSRTRAMARPSASEWLHVMLRDSIGHNEPREKRKTVLEKRRGDRQDSIERLPFAQVYGVLIAIAVKLRAHLEDKHRIEFAPTIKVSDYVAPPLG